MKATLPIHLLVLSIAGQLLLPAQVPRVPRIEWQQTIGGTSYDGPAKVVEMPDGGFVFGGLSLSGISGNKTSPSWDTNAIYGGDFWVVKLPKERPIVWFLTATDERKATVSTEHEVLEK